MWRVIKGHLLRFKPLLNPRNIKNHTRGSSLLEMSQNMLIAEDVVTSLRVTENKGRLTVSEGPK